MAEEQLPVGWSNSQKVMLMMIAINALNYLDRGIIAGATIEFGVFISQANDLNAYFGGIGHHRVDMLLGLLQSLFVVGYSVAGCVLGNMTHKHNAFALMGWGLLSWSLSVGLCGAAQWADSYVLLAVARALSGIGEASFMISAPPFFSDHGGEKKVGA